MRRLIVAVVLVAAGAGLVTSFAAAFRQEAPSYRALATERGNIEVVIAATGKVRAKESVDVGAQVSGQLDALHVHVGARVNQGDLLAEIDPTIAQARVDQGRAQLKELRASLTQQEAALELARLKSARAEMLRTADAISEADFEIAAAEEKIAAGKLAQLAAQIERQESTLSADLANLEYTKIYAPISGTVVSQAAVEGQTLNANQTTPTVLTIADLTVMTVEAEISEADVLRIEAGQPAVFRLLGSDREWRTEVRQVLPTPEVVNDVVLFKALLDIDNSDGQLRPEMTAQVFFSQGRAQDAVLVPVTALQERARGPAPRDPALQQASAQFPHGKPAHVLVSNGEGALPRDILVGLRNRSMAEVLYGLEAGETVLMAQSLPAQAEGRGSRPPYGIGRR